MDGFVLTHAMEPLEVPDQAAVDAFLPAFTPRQRLDPDEPVSIGAMVGPEAFTEVRYLAFHRQREALARIPEIAAEFEAAFGRDSGGLLHRYRCEDAHTVVLALGSVLGTLKDAVDGLRDAGVAVGVVGLTSFRPFPAAAVRAALADAARVIVLERAFSVGAGGIVSDNVHMALAGLDQERHTVIAGLGGRPVTRSSLSRMIRDAVAGRLEPIEFLDLDRDLVDRELARQRANPRSGPAAENILRDVGIVGARPH
jgi:pyruvate ferredoxin oxidoreductase alpha subunit